MTKHVGSPHGPVTNLPKQQLSCLLIAVVAVMLADSPARANGQAPYQPHSYRQSDPQPRSLDDYVEGGGDFAILGVTLHEEERGLQSGASIRGLLVTKIEAGSPAAKAGLTAFDDKGRKAVTFTAIVAAMAFPPAVLVVPLLAAIPTGQSGDLVIAVDSNRVTNVLDFEDQLTDARPGETVYLTLIRSGERVQVAVQLPPASN